MVRCFAEEIKRANRGTASRERGALRRKFANKNIDRFMPSGDDNRI